MVYTWIKKQYQFLNENRVPKNSIKLFYSRLFEKYNTLKINWKTIRFKIKVQALKYTSWMKPGKWSSYKYQTTADLVYYWKAFVLLHCLRKRVAFRVAGWMKNGLRRKWIYCSNCILLKLNNFCSCIKKKSLNEAWPCILSLDHNIHGKKWFLSAMDKMFFEVKKCVGNVFSRDLKKLNLWEKTAVEKSAWIKACYVPTIHCIIL